MFRRAVPFALCAATLASAQGLPPGGGIPIPKEMIRANIQRVFEAAEVKEVEIAGLVKVSYKAIPTNPNEIARILGQQMKGQLPGGIDDKQVEAFLKQYEGQITELLNEMMADIGSIEPLVELQVKTKRIPVGKWRFGVSFKADKPEAFVITGKDLPEDGKPIPVRLQTRSVDLQDALAVELQEPKKQKKGEEKFKLRLTFLRFEARSKNDVEVASAAGGDDADD